MISFWLTSNLSIVIHHEHALRDAMEITPLDYIGRLNDSFRVGYHITNPFDPPCFDNARQTPTPAMPSYKYERAANPAIGPPAISKHQFLLKSFIKSPNCLWTYRLEASNLNVVV